jgi:hypothetical protein
MKHTFGPPQAVTGRDSNFLYVDDVHTSQETHLWASTGCYGERFLFLYVDDVMLLNFAID